MYKLLMYSTLKCLRLSARECSYGAINYDMNGVQNGMFCEDVLLKCSCQMARRTIGYMGVDVSGCVYSGCSIC